MLKLREIPWHLKKPARTVQSYFPFLKETKDSLYRAYRRTLRRPSEPYFSGLRAIAEKFAGSYVDIGGNTGQSIESIRLFVPDAEIISFEPNPNLAGKLAQRYRNNRKVGIRAIGLSDKPGKMQLHVPTYHGFVYDGLASLEKESAMSWINSDTVYFFSDRHLRVQSFDCLIETLDDQDIGNPIFIKVDVEGCEFQVLQGGIKTLAKHRPILLIEGLQDKPEIEDLIRPLGYEPYELQRSSFVAGYSPGCTFLITPERIAVLKGKGGSARPVAW